MGARRTGIALLIAAGVLMVLGLGLAFTIFGDIALLLAVVVLATGAVLTARSPRH